MNTYTYPAPRAVMPRPKLLVHVGDDAPGERQTILDTLAALRFAYDFDVYRSGDVVPNFDRQGPAWLDEQILIRECDVVIAVLWRSPGEPISVPGPRGPSQSYTTLAGIVAAIDAYEQNGDGWPRIMIYRKLDDPLPDGGRDAEAVIAYAKVVEFLKQFAPDGRYPAWIYPFHANKFDGIFKKHIGVVLRSLLYEPAGPEHRAALLSTGAGPAGHADDNRGSAASAAPPAGAQGRPTAQELIPEAALGGFETGETIPGARLSALPSSGGESMVALDDLTVLQLAQAQDAFLNAFKREELAQVVYFAVKRRYEEIVTGGTFEYEVFELLLWADRQGKVRELVSMARRRNPGNSRLRRLAAGLGLA